MAEYKGFLTETDREFLRGEKEYSGENAKQMRYQRRRSIRERSRGALFDMQLLFNELSDREIEKIFHPPDDQSPGDFYRAISDTLGLVYLGSKVMDDNPEIMSPWFNQLLELGIRLAEQRRLGVDTPTLGKSAGRVSVDISIEHHHPTAVDFEAVAGKIAAGTEFEITEAELRAFVDKLGATEEFDPKAAVEAIRERTRGLGEE